MLTRFLAELQQDPFFRDASAAMRVLPERSAQYGSSVTALHDALERLCPSGLYSHQATVLEHARRGEHVVVATPTASGKTLCFNLPVVESLLATGGHALYLFPLKALEHDQLKSLHRLRDAIGLHESFTAAILDGDVKPAERKRLRASPPQIMLSNPDLVHATLLPSHPHWASFWQGLRWVVLDELHTYRGVFGSHVLHVLRRLQRVAEWYGARPQVLAASATIGNPRELAERLFGLPFTLVEESGAPRGPRHVFLLSPDEHPLAFATALFARCVRAGIKTIAFCKSRRATELLYAWVVERHPELRNVVSAYRSGYLPEERREIEAALFGGRLQGVVSTSALELGIDVGGMDAAILVGYPGSIMSTWQRAGRAGRGAEPAAMFVVAGVDALDQYYTGEPEAFFAATPEHAVVDPQNPIIRAGHLLCAGAELPLREAEPAFVDLDWRTARSELVAKGLLLQSAAGDTWVPLEPRPHAHVDLRNVGETFTIQTDERILGTVGGSRAFTECHVGAVYMHRGQHWQVTAFDSDRRRVLVSEADGTWYTVPRSAKQTEILEVLNSRSLGSAWVHYGRLRITQRMTGYERRASFDQKLLGTFELELPPTIYETEGLWIEPGEAVHAALAAQHRMGSLHGLEHAMIALSPLFTLCDPADLGGITFVEHPQVSGGAVFLYDAYPGGIGLARRTHALLPQLLSAVRARVEQCGCKDGCPGCVHSPRCGAGNFPLDKQGTVLALRALLEGSATRPAAAHVAPEPRVVYFDLETLRSAQDVGGWRNIHRMGMALGVVFDSKTLEFTTYREPEVEALVAHLRAADLVVGHNVLRFDYAVLSAYAGAALDRVPTFDMLVALRAVLRQRLGLANLGACTLGRGKSSDGLQSLQWVAQGDLERVEAYCRDDVALTRDIFQHAVTQGWLAFERKGQRLRTPPLDWNVHRLAQEAARRRAIRVRSAPPTLFALDPPRPAW